MSDALNELLAEAGVGAATPAHWQPITRSGEFDAQQGETRARLAEVYEPGMPERSMVHRTLPHGPFVNVMFDPSGFIKSLIQAAAAAEEASARMRFMLDEFDRAELQGILGPSRREAELAAMTPRDRSLALRRDEAQRRCDMGMQRARKHF